ncbi:hypothetical protein IQ238_05860 [Pleurocapsales cyanobacterium LEGE 06147]|nr:hypothetical protein [Pleurocapsales cyanobacterium LEGE 06147]
MTFTNTKRSQFSLEIDAFDRAYKELESKTNIRFARLLAIAEALFGKGQVESTLAPRNEFLGLKLKSVGLLL